MQQEAAADVDGPVEDGLAAGEAAVDSEDLAAAVLVEVVRAAAGSGSE